MAQNPIEEDGILVISLQAGNYFDTFQITQLGN